MRPQNLYPSLIFVTIAIIVLTFVGYPETVNCQYGIAYSSVSDWQSLSSLSQGAAFGAAVSDYYSISTLSQPISTSQNFSMSSLHNLPSISKPIATPTASMSEFHNLPTLQKDKPENQWFHDWVSNFGSVPITSYPAVRVGTNQIDVWNIPHEWDIATQGWDDYENLVWSNMKNQTPFEIEDKSIVSLPSLPWPGQPSEPILAPGGWPIPIRFCPPGYLGKNTCSGIPDGANTFAPPMYANLYPVDY